MFGPFAVHTVDGINVTPSARKERALLAYCLLCDHYSLERDHLAGLLWGDRAEEQARSSLRQAIYDLRQFASPGANLLSADRNHLFVNPSNAVTDIQQLDIACAEGDSVAALQLVGARPQDLLTDLDGIDEAFDDWLAVERSRRRDERRQRLLELARGSLSDGDVDVARELALALLAADGLDEAAARLAMEASHRRGDRDMLRRVFARHEEALSRELGVPPPEDLAALYRRLSGMHVGDNAHQLGLDGPSQPTLASPPEAQTGHPRPMDRKRRGVWASAVAVAILLMAATSVWLRPVPPSPSLRIEVMPLQSAGGDDAPVFARTLQDNVTDVLAQSGVETVAGAPRRKSDLLLRGSVVETQGRRLEVHLFLEDVDSGLTLWSDQFERRTTSSDLLADQAAAAAAETIYTIIEAREQKGLSLDPEILALFIRGEQFVKSPQLLHEGTPRDIFEQVVARAPNFAGGHAILAMALVNEARIGEPAQRPAWLARAAREADAAIRIDPYAAGAGYDAHFLIGRVGQPRDIVHAEPWLSEGLRRAPEFPFLSMRECRMLTETGRGMDARPYCQRALALRPMAGPIGYTYGLALSISGAQKSAEDAVARAFRYNPDHAMTRRSQLEMAAFGGHPERAMQLLDNPDTQPLNLDETSAAALRGYLRARLTGRNAESAAAAVRQATVTDGLDVYYAVEALTALRDLDGAYAVMRLPKLESLLFSMGTSFLFEPWTAPLRADPRFWPMMADLGIAQFWAAHDKWPDFCGREMALKVCKTQTARVLSAREHGARS